jgi:hypothetical protein
MERLGLTAPKPFAFSPKINLLRMSSYLSTAVKLNQAGRYERISRATPSAATAQRAHQLMLGISKRSSYSLMLSIPLRSMMTLDIKDFT